MKKAADQAKSNKDKTFRNKNKRKFKRKKSAGKQTKRPFGHIVREEAYTNVGKLSSGTPASYTPRPLATIPHIKHAQNVWIKTYQNIVKWQFQHQVNYWKQHALQLREENARLKRRLAVPDSEDEDAEEAEVERQQKQDADADDDENDALDEEFIAFMEISARHRLERRMLKNESVH